MSNLIPIEAFATQTAGHLLERWNYVTSLGPGDVFIRVTHCGVCRSDIHLIDNDWGTTTYPLVPGHEVVGVVERLGAGVADLSVGQRVAVGWQRGACMVCDVCVVGRENLCVQRLTTCGNGMGGFAQGLVVDSAFAFTIPESLRSEHVAPLMCGGVTVFTALRRLCAPGARVGIVGIGGLGHLAIQFARALGFKVTAFSWTEAKRRAAIELGAEAFVDVSAEQDVGRRACSLDVILVTAPGDLEWSAWLGMLRPNGVLCLATAPPLLEIPTRVLLVRQICVVGTTIGGRQDVRDALDVAARCQVLPWIECLPMESVNAAIAMLRQRNVRFRVVLVN